MSITYACTYHNPTATMGHSIHNVDTSKPLPHTMPYTLSAICPAQRKPGFIREENTSPNCQMPSNVSICPLNSVTMTNCSQIETPIRTTRPSLRRFLTVFCRNYLVMQTDCCSSCPGGWSQRILEMKMLDVEVLHWCGYTWSAVVRQVGCTAKFSETPLRRLIVEKLTFNSRATALVDIPAVSMPITRSLKIVTSVTLCCVIKLQILEWPFIVASLRHNCAIIMLSNQHLEMPHLYRWFRMQQHDWSSANPKEHVSPLFISLDWLPVAARIKFKTLMLAYITVTGSAPSYFHSLMTIYIPSRSLRSLSEWRLMVPSQRGTKSLSRTFSFIVPGWWNELPTPIRDTESWQFSSNTWKLISSSIYINPSFP